MSDETDGADATENPEAPAVDVDVPVAEASDEFAVDGATEEVAFHVMRFESVLYDLTDPSPMVHLLEAESPFRYLVIPIALADAVALQLAHSQIERPLHDRHGDGWQRPGDGDVHRARCL